MRPILCSIAALSLLTCTGIQAPSSGQLVHMNMGKPQQEKIDPLAGLTPDDPQVQASTVPSSDCQIITKVGWCEVQIYGHTFSDYGLTKGLLPASHMHLPDRLVQLNKKLRFEPGKSGLQLMDDTDALVKFVAAKKREAALRRAAARQGSDSHGRDISSLVLRRPR